MAVVCQEKVGGAGLLQVPTAQHVQTTTTSFPKEPSIQAGI